MKTLPVAFSKKWLSYIAMFLRRSKRIKNGKEHFYWSVVENKRIAQGKVVQRQVLYLGELNGGQEASWRKSVELFDQDEATPRQMALFSEDHAPNQLEAIDFDNVPIVKLQLSKIKLLHPRQWGACWLGCHLWDQLGLADFWHEHLAPSRKGTRWDLVLQVLVIYRLIAPGSEWYLNRHWFTQTALSDLLGADFSLVEIHRLYECHDKLVEHKHALFNHLTRRWKDLFGAKFEVLLYDLTSTYFESNPQADPDDKRRFGYSRDKRSDCVQVVIALIVTPEGFPIAYEVLAGNTSDKTTLKDFLVKIENLYGKSERIWIMDRGIPTEQTLREMRQSNSPVSYLVGTPKGRLGALEKALAGCEWHQARDSVRVKMLPQDGEVYVYAQSEQRILKERAMRRRRLRIYMNTLKAIQARKRPLTRDAMHQALGAAKKAAGRDARFIEFKVTLSDIEKELESKPAEEKNEEKTIEVTKESKKCEQDEKEKASKPKAKSKVKKGEQTARLCWKFKRKELREARRKEGRYLLRSNLCGSDPEKLWEMYIQLTEIEQAFKELKGDLALRPIHHQLEKRVEAHIFISFLAYCLQVTLKARLKRHAGGLTARAVLEKFATVQMLDVHLPTSDGREIVMTRYTQPEKDLELLLGKLEMTLPKQAPPRIGAPSK